MHVFYLFFFVIDTPTTGIYTYGLTLSLHDALPSFQVRVGGQVEESAVKGFGVDDIRFTTKGDTLYAMGLERPKDGAVLIKTLYAGNPYLDAPIKSIELLDGGKITWQQTPTGLKISLPPAGDGRTARGREGKGGCSTCRQ